MVKDTDEVGGSASAKVDGARARGEAVKVVDEKRVRGAGVTSLEVQKTGVSLIEQKQKVSTVFFGPGATTFAAVGGGGVRTPTHL